MPWTLKRCCKRKLIARKSIGQGYVVVCPDCREVVRGLDALTLVENANCIQMQPDFFREVQAEAEVQIIGELP